MTEQQQKSKKAARPTTLDLSGEDITAFDDDTVASLLQEAMEDAADSAVKPVPEPASGDDPADGRGDASEAESELEESKMDMLTPLEMDVGDLEVLSGDGGAMLPMEDPDLAFPELPSGDDTVEDDPPPEPQIPDEIIEELELLRGRLDDLTEREQAAEIERRSLLDANESLRAQSTVYQSRLLKLNEEFEGFRRRTERDKGENIRRETERVVRAVLPVVDHMELALTHARAHPEGTGLLEGFVLILDQFHRALAGLGVDEVDVEAGQIFDPNLHDALMREVTEDVDANRITRGLRTGYVLGDRLLRAARVAVAEAAAVPQAETGAETETETETKAKTKKKPAAKAKTKAKTKTQAKTKTKAKAKAKAKKKAPTKAKKQPAAKAQGSKSKPRKKAKAKSKATGDGDAGTQAPGKTKNEED
ncbi:MAG: nucleotide exchange factor GrpE [Myxococcota bacterium]|nr:nucleotide exchange factor GrpE [Myxococcota bacterium]